jgi:hypothetical protein
MKHVRPECVAWPTRERRQPGAAKRAGSDVNGGRQPDGRRRAATQVGSGRRPSRSAGVRPAAAIRRRRARSRQSRGSACCCSWLSSLRRAPSGGASGRAESGPLPAAVKPLSLWRRRRSLAFRPGSRTSVQVIARLYDGRNRPRARVLKETLMKAFVLALAVGFGAAAPSPTSPRRAASVAAVATGMQRSVPPRATPDAVPARPAAPTAAAPAPPPRGRGRCRRQALVDGSRSPDSPPASASRRCSATWASAPSWPTS